MVPSESLPIGGEYHERRYHTMKIYKLIPAVILCLLLSAVPALAVESDTSFMNYNGVVLPAAFLSGEGAELSDWEKDPDGSVLTASGGVNYYFGQKETYYNLNMDGVVSNARSMGIKGDYWVREDGCKMLGDYIMVAANLDVLPRGSIVPTSLGLGIVVDTGGFASANTTQVDIAVNW